MHKTSKKMNLDHHQYEEDLNIRDSLVIFYVSLDVFECFDFHCFLLVNHRYCWTWFPKWDMHKKNCKTIGSSQNRNCNFQVHYKHCERCKNWTCSRCVLSPHKWGHILAKEHCKIRKGNISLCDNFFTKWLETASICVHLQPGDLKAIYTWKPYMLKAWRWWSVPKTEKDRSSQKAITP